MNLEFFGFGFALDFLGESLHHEVDVVGEIARAAERVRRVEVELEDFLAPARVTPLDWNGRVADHLEVLDRQPRLEVRKRS